jgi:putative aldouronate transport system substrate-binding protein
MMYLSLRKSLLFFCFLSAAALAFGTGGRETGRAGSSQAGGKTTLTIDIPANSRVTDYENNYLTQYLEKLHNVNLDFYLLPESGADRTTKLALMVGSNELHDIILANIPEATLVDYGTNGALIPLNRYINDPSLVPNFAAIPKEHKDLLLNSMISADGNIYALGKLVMDTWGISPHRFFINRAWLDKLGLPVPATTDDLRNVLIAFRDRDPNGNGRKDEVGLYGQYDGGYGEDVISTLINAFIFYNKGSLGLDAGGNTVTTPFTDSSFRKALRYLNGLYREGVLPPSIFTDDTQQFRAILNVQPPVVGAVSAGSAGNWANFDYNPNFIAMQLIPPLTGPDGVCYTPYAPVYPGLIGSITAKCKNPETAFKVLESFYNEDVSLISRFGEEGVDWSRKPEDLARDTNSYIEMGMYSGLAVFVLNDIIPNPGNKFWQQSHPQYLPPSIMDRMAFLTSPYDPKFPSSQLRGIHAKYYLDNHPAHVLPPLKYTRDELVNIGEIITNVNTYVDLSVAEFVTGARDINSDNAWNAYLRELGNMGLRNWITTAQTAYNRQKR